MHSARVASLLIIAGLNALALAACDGRQRSPDWLDAALEETPLPQGNRPPMIGSGRDVYVVRLGEGQATVLDSFGDPDGDPVSVTFRDLTEGIAMELVEDTISVAVDYGAAVDEEGTARGFVDLDDGRGGRASIEVVIGVSRLAWQEPETWMESNGPRPRRHSVVIGGGDVVYVLFGESADEASEPLGDAWRYSTTDRVWSPVALVGDVPAPGAGKAFATQGNLLHGGIGPHGSPLGDLHRVTLEDATVLVFTAIEQVNPPPPRGHHLFVSDDRSTAGEPPSAPTFVAFGGRGDPSTGAALLGDTWTMQLDGGVARWTALDLEEHPSARAEASTALDEELGRAFVHGGLVGEAMEPGTDTWQLDLHGDHGPSWSRLEVDHSPSPRRGAAALWDASASRVLLFGGLGGDGTVLGDLHALDVAPGAPRWVTIEAHGMAAPAWGGNGIVGLFYPEMDPYTPRARMRFGFGQGEGGGRVLQSLRDVPPAGFENR